MSNIYSVRIPSRNVNSVVELKSLVYDAKQQGKQITIPPEKEIRISHGDWKTKEKPGTGKSSSRDNHVKAAFDQAKELWNKDLFKRECDNVTDVYSAIVGANKKITANSLALLIWVAECVDKLSEKTGLAKAQCLELLAPSLGDTANLKTLPSPNWLAEHIDTLAQESKLDKSQCLELLAHVMRNPRCSMNWRLRRRGYGSRRTPGKQARWARLLTLGAWLWASCACPLSHLWMPGRRQRPSTSRMDSKR